MNMGKLKCIFELDLTEDKPTESWYPTRAKGCPKKKKGKQKKKYGPKVGCRGFFFSATIKKNKIMVSETNKLCTVIECFLIEELAARL